MKLYFKDVIVIEVLLVAVIHNLAISNKFYTHISTHRFKSSGTRPLR